VEKQYISSRTEYGKIGKLEEVEAHNQRFMEVKTLLINKIEEHNKNLSDKDRYFREITDYQIMKNISYSFGSNHTQNLTESFNEFYNEMESVYKKKKQHLYKENGNHIVEQVVSLSNERAKEILNQKDGDKLLLEHFKKLAEEVNKEYGFEPIHIDLHLDEGHISHTKNEMGVIESSEVKENIHAHIVYLNYDFLKQKTVLRNMKKQDFRDIQDLSAKVFKDLGFQRGEDKRNSNKTHLKTTAYVEEQQNLESQIYVENKVNSNIEDMEYSLEDLKDIQFAKNDISIELNELYEAKKQYDNIEDLKSQQTKINETISQYEATIQSLKDSKKDITALNISNEEKKKLHKEKQKEIKKFQGLRRDLKEEIKSLNKEHKTKMEDLKLLNETISEREKSLKKLEGKEAKIKHTETLNQKQLRKEHFKLFKPVLSKIKDTPTFNKDKFINEEVKPMLYKVLAEATQTKLTLNDIKNLEDTIKDMEATHIEEIKQLKTNNETDTTNKVQSIQKVHKEEIESIEKSFTQKLKVETDLKDKYQSENDTLREEVADAKSENNKLYRTIGNIEEDNFKLKETIKEKNKIISNLNSQIEKMKDIGKKIYSKYKEIKKDMRTAKELVPNLQQLIKYKIKEFQHKKQLNKDKTITHSKGLRL